MIADVDFHGQRDIVTLTIGGNDLDRTSKKDSTVSSSVYGGVSPLDESPVDSRTVEQQ